MGFDERAAALRIAELMGENRRLREELSTIQGQVESLQAENRRLQEHLSELERAAARQAAPFRRAEKQKVPPGQRKRPGRPPGHRGTSRPLPEVVDDEAESPLAVCPQCGGEVAERTPLVQYIEEIPPLRPRVTRLVTWRGQCPRCGEVRSTHPLQTSTAQGAAAVQLGPRALAIGALLNKHLGLTMRKACRTLKLLGLSLTAGGLSQALSPHGGQGGGRLRRAAGHDPLERCGLLRRDELVGRPAGVVAVDVYDPGRHAVPGGTQSRRPNRP